MEDIHLDPSIRTQALIPIFLLVILASVIRQHISHCVRAEQRVDMQQVKSNNIIASCQILKTNYRFLSEAAFKTRKLFFTKKDEGLLWFPPTAITPLEAMQRQDPSEAMGHLKSQSVFIVLQGGLAYLVNYLFSGFIVAKAPFPLTYRFKSMLQRGIDVSSLDVTYVSSLSWYFFIMMGSSGFIMLINYIRGQDTSAIMDVGATDFGLPIGDQAAAMNPMAMLMPGMASNDSKKQFKQERDSLHVLHHTFSLNNVEESLMRIWESQSPEIQAR